MVDPAVDRYAGGGRRPGPVDVEPGPRLGTVVTLLEQVDRIIEGVQPVLRTVERMTGLTLPQIGVLLTFVDEDAVGSPPPLRVPVLEELVRSGLVRRKDPSGSAGSPGTSWVLTDRGRAALEQVQGLRIRILDTVATSLGRSELDAAVASVRRIADAVEKLPEEALPGPHPLPLRRPGVRPGPA